MYYSYVENEYVATSFSPTRTDLALKLNSLTAMGAHERPTFNELRSTVVSRGIFIHLQSLIAR
jgi:hypothetical protein